MSGTEPKSINILLDIWSTRKQEAVLGIQAKIIKNWKLKTVLLGFLDFPEAHTADNIRRKVENHLSKQYEINLSEVR